MGKKLVVALALAVGAYGSTLAQENTINRIPKVGIDTNQKVYTQTNTGFWIAAEALAGYSIRPYNHNFGLGEIDVTCGYRFNEFIKVGAGIGARAYFLQGDARRHSSIWGMPLFVAARGDMMGSTYRNVVPYWGFETGASVADGFMLRPTIGLRFGETRRSWTLAISYMGQVIDSSDINGLQKNKFTSFICLRTGFEF